MQTSTTEEPGLNPAPRTPAPAHVGPAISQASRECARELALELSDGMSAQLSIIATALTSPFPSDHLARAAWRDARRIGAALSKVFEALGPLPGPDGAVVPGKSARLQ